MMLAESPPIQESEENNHLILHVQHLLGEHQKAENIYQFWTQSLRW